jgi:hypothetical protein
MFDNEIDWVKRILSAFAVVSRREAPGNCKVTLECCFNTRPSTCNDLSQDESGSVQSKKSVFRSVTRERVSVASHPQAEI